MSRSRFGVVVIVTVLFFASLMGGLLALSSHEAEAFSGIGNGTLSDPYLITNVSQLQEMNDNLLSDYALNQSIDASVTSGWSGGAGFEPIGSDISSFSGTLDGRGYTVTGLHINRPGADNVGLFGVVGAAGEVEDIAVISANISGRNNVGGLVGQNYGTVSSSSVTGRVTGVDLVGGLVGLNRYGTVSGSYAGSNVVGNNAVGGLAGENRGGTGSGSVINSSATGTVAGNSDIGGLVGWNNQGAVSGGYATGSVSGTSDIGGLVGENYYGTVSGSYATGTVSGTDDCIGGLVGRSYYSSVSDSYATGNLEGHNAVGGLVGENRGGTGGGEVSNSYATGDVEGNNAVGGLVGFNNYIVSKSYAEGIVSGSGLVGGLVGENSGGTVNNSYATGIVSGTSDVGGLVGFNNNIVSNSYAMGDVNGSSLIGGLVGENDIGGIVTGSFYDRITTGQSDKGKGEPKTTAEMNSIDTFVGWSINESEIELNNGYPYLSWQLSDSTPVWYIYRPPCPAPDIPCAPYPESGTANTSIDLALNWSDCANADYYNIYLGLDYPEYYDSTYNSSYDLSQLAYSTTFYWRIVAVNACGSTWGPVWNFSTVCAIPSEPESPLPGNNSTNSPIDIVLSWNASIHAVSYDVYFGDSSPPTYHGNTSNSSYQLLLLNYSTTYYWQIVAFNNSTCSINGTIWSFTTVVAPTPTPIITPTPVTTPTPTETIPPIDEDVTPLWFWIVLGLDVVLTLVMMGSIYYIVNKRSKQKRKKEEEAKPTKRLASLFRVPRLRRGPKTPPESEEGTGTNA